MLEQLYDLIPKHYLEKSGSVFYSGRDAFTGQKDVYLLGLNPGGDPKDPNEHIIKNHALSVMNDKPNDWSEYRDESWQGHPPGSYRMQPRVLHLLKQLNLSPGQVPASNLVFFRSKGAKNVNRNHVNECWSFHECVINELKPKAIICFGTTNTGKFVREKLNATKVVDIFVESNNRKVSSYAYRCASGLLVISLSHPSRYAWNIKEADPSEMVRRVLYS